MAKYKVLSTKKLEPSLAEAVKQNDIELIEQEFISIKPIRNKETFDQIIGLAEDKKLFIALTSSNAVDALDSYMHVGDTYYVTGWKIFCLSGKTKEAILSSKNLEKNIVGEAPNATALAREIIKQEVKEIVFFCSNKRRDELPSILKDAGIKVHEVVVYETIETPAIATEVDAILFFSPSAVQSFFSVNQLKENTICFAIGQTTAESLAGFTKNKIFISKVPGQEALLTEVINYFKNKVSHLN